MKNSFCSVAASTFVVAMGMAVSTAMAGSDSIQTQLTGVAAPELPVQAAKIVAGSGADSLTATTQSVIDSVVSSSPAAAISVVSAVAQQTPQAAPIAAAEAAKLQPKQAAWIARAAAGSAPSQAANIVLAVCKALPSSYASSCSVVATAVAQVVPSASKEILSALSEAVPALKPYIDQASATYQGSSVGVILEEAQRLIVSSMQFNNSTPLFAVAPSSAGASPTLSAPLPPPVQIPPITPAPSSPVEVSYTNSVPVPPGGGRDYSGG